MYVVETELCFRKDFSRDPGSVLSGTGTYRDRLLSLLVNPEQGCGLGWYLDVMPKCDDVM